MSYIQNAIKDLLPIPNDLNDKNEVAAFHLEQDKIFYAVLGQKSFFS